MTDDFNKNSLKLLLKNIQSVSLSLQIIKKLYVHKMQRG